MALKRKEVVVDRVAESTPMHNKDCVFQFSELQFSFLDDELLCMAMSGGELH
jgi:hypothetical protein